MAKDEKPKRIVLTSPRGVFQWPKLNEPDLGTKDYPNPDGSYSVNLVLKADDPETKKFIKTLTPHYEAAMAEAKEAFKGLKVETRKKLKNVTENALFTEVYDKETEEPTGEIRFKFAMRASGEYKKDGPKKGKRWNRKPVIFDAKGNRMASPPAIWGGTEGRISFELSPYFIPGTGAAGLKLGLEAAKILSLVSAGERNADAYGLGGEEDGYEYSAEEQARDAMESDESTSDNADVTEDDGSGDF